MKSISRSFAPAVLALIAMGRLAPASSAAPQTHAEPQVQTQVPSLPQAPNQAGTACGASSCTAHELCCPVPQCPIPPDGLPVAPVQAQPGTPCGASTCSAREMCCPGCEGQLYCTPKAKTCPVPQCPIPPDASVPAAK